MHRNGKWSAAVDVAGAVGLEPRRVPPHSSGIAVLVLVVAATKYVADTNSS